MRRAWPLSKFAVVLLLTLAGCLSGCAAADPVALPVQRPSGREGEVLSWEATTAAAGPRHNVRLGFETDAAQLMGWAKTSLRYRVLVDLWVEGPQGKVAQKTLTVAVTERRQVGEDKVNNSVQFAYKAAGILQESGFRDVAPVDAFGFTPGPGRWTLHARMRIPDGGNRKAIRVIRNLKVEIRARAGNGGSLSEWTALEPRRE